MMKVTVITMHQGHNDDIHNALFTQVVEGVLTEEQKDEWRRNHECGKYYPEDEGEDYQNNMFFRTLGVLPNPGDLILAGNLFNADDDCPPDFETAWIATGRVEEEDDTTPKKGARCPT